MPPSLSCPPALGSPSPPSPAKHSTSCGAVQTSGTPCPLLPLLQGVFLALAEVSIQINQGDTLGAPGGVRRSVAQLDAHRPVPTGSGMGEGSAGGLGEPLTLLREPGPKRFRQGEVNQIDEGPP